MKEHSRDDIEKKSNSEEGKNLRYAVLVFIYPIYFDEVEETKTFVLERGGGKGTPKGIFTFCGKRKDHSLEREKKSRKVHILTIDICEIISI